MTSSDVPTSEETVEEPVSEGLSVSQARKWKERARKLRRKKREAKKAKQEQAAAMAERERKRVDQERRDREAAEDNARKRRQSAVVVVRNVPWSTAVASDDNPSSSDSRSFSFLASDACLDAPPKQDHSNVDADSAEPAAKRQKGTAATMATGGSLFGCLAELARDGQPSFHRDDPSNLAVAKGWRHTRAALARNFREKRRSAAKRAKALKKREPPAN
jgi:hypothetical protein